MSGLRRLGDALIIVLAVVVDLITWAGSRDLRDGSMVPLLVIPVLTVAVYATLLLRWRRPLLIFAVQWCFALTSLIVPEFQPFAGLLLALHAVASRRPSTWSVPALASLVVPFGIYSYNSAERGSGSVVADFGQLLVLWLLIGAGAWGVGRLSYLAARRAWRLRQLEAAEAAEAVRAERMRLARELHDIVAHTVTVMMLQATGAKTLLGDHDARVHRSLVVIEQAGVQAMAELHRMLRLLRTVDPESEDDLPASQPTVADIADLVRLATAAGQDVTVVGDGSAPGPLDPSVAAAAYRIVQESLTNSLKHAGTGAVVTVRLHWREQSLEVAVTDRGGSAAEPAERTAALSSGHGLQGLRERVTMIGGTLTCGPTADGFQVTARLPLPGVAVPPTISAGSAG